MQPKVPSCGYSIVTWLLVLLVTAACNGGASGDRRAEAAIDGARAALLGVEYGRLVDVYTWQRVAAGDADRLDARRRRPVLFRRNVLVHPNLNSENPHLFEGARFRFLPHDPRIGHRQLLILYDAELEPVPFDAALAAATSALPLVAPHFAFALGLPKAAPVVPRDATLRLSFDRPLGLDQDYFDATPGLVQVLELAGDPEVLGTALAYTPVAARVLVADAGRSLLVDLEVSGLEAKGRVANPTGLPEALDTVTANTRIALPTSGPLAQRFRVRADNVPQFNDRGMSGVSAVIRDFRSGSTLDANRGSLPSFEAPRLTARRDMGLLAMDPEARTLRVHKRKADLVLRPRVPFVDGPYSLQDGRPLGPRRVPQERPLLSGDLIWQTVLSPHTGESVAICAEILENRAIVAREGDPALGTGMAAEIAELVVDRVHGYDSAGNALSFEVEDAGAGKDCTAVVHFCSSLRVGAQQVEVGDQERVAEFLTIVPAPPRFDANGTPLPNGQDVDPAASVTVHFSVPIDATTLRTEDNMVLANHLGSEPAFITHPKTGGLTIVPTQVTDLDRDGTTLRLNTPLGLFHEVGERETYYWHLFDGELGPRGRSGELLDLNEGQAAGLTAISAALRLDAKAPSNLVGSYLVRMNAVDENGTSEASSSMDHFGQFQLRNGRMYGSVGQRFSRVLDTVRMSAVRNDLSRRCESGPSFLYSTPLLNVGRVEPFVSEGSRMQQAYREVDFDLSYTDPAELEIDVEQLHWAPFVARVPAKLTYDLFDRISMTLAHSEKRPDIRVLPTCRPEFGANLSGLETTFEANYLDNGVRAEVVKDQAYTIDPNNAFAAVTGATMISYPRFRESFTWRDRRLMSIAANDAILGLGGSQRPDDGTAPDRTRDVSSPHIPEVDPDLDGANARQDDDYKGDRRQDLAPFALPLLVDLSIHPDDVANGKCIADNLFQVGVIGLGLNARVHSTGGIDGQLQEILVDPTNERQARGGWIGGAGNSVLVPPGDSVVYWAQADFVRRVSVVTSGYFDTLLPGRNEVQGPAGWTPTPKGFPDLEKLGAEYGAHEFAVLVDPAPEDLPLGTELVIEYRGAERFDRAADPYSFEDNETAASRNNLLNPHYACEQYRYLASGRVDARGVTTYVQDIDDLVDTARGVAPRYLNYRLTFVNNTTVTPIRTPYVSSLAILWRVRPRR